MQEQVSENQPVMRESGSEITGTIRDSAIDATRRTFLRTVAASGVALTGSLIFPAVITPARGAEKSIKIGIWAGPDGELIRSTIVKRFEEKHRVKILIDEGITTEQLARMRATKNNPTHTVMFL